MPIYEYKVMPAPEKGRKGKGVKGPRERFANALETLMNELGAEGWEYLRADTLPNEERSGLTGSSTTYQNMLVFRREKASAETHPVSTLSIHPQEAASAADAGADAAPRAPEAPAAPHAGETEKPAESETDTAAAAAAAAALTAYRETSSAAPKLGPAPERNPERSQD
ncbi:hypothetical protein R3X27_04615 [Tropicimonas sp. TH_r6]|uniref:hypothetical protein n=1 Tax=Tropicimonas sp. TH_r6 TaxID=3082085 RepID=UPI002954D36B|nr:hypothetical protein [Tropicimonas sp. TH_r6]MDV7141961.1 hypothetical protein [Tropicimonas sp. TH_r6]